MKTRVVGNLKLRALTSISVEQSSSSHHNGDSHAVSCGAMPATGLWKWAGLRRAGLQGFALLLLAALAAAQAFAGETVVHSFAPSLLNGSNPDGNPCLGPGGMLYGTTSAGGASGGGVIWRVNRAGHETVLHNFTGGADGAYPFYAVLCDSADKIYGTTSYGGSAFGYNGFGVVFRIDGAGHEIVLHTFTGGADGGNPYSSLIQDSAGNLYGNTYSGGTAGAGLVFKLDRHGNETVLYNFTGGADGGNPVGGVIQDPAGNFYGVAESGGSYGNGVVFKLDALGNETVLYDFTGGNDGLYPNGVIRDSAGNLYGTTYNGGTAGAGVVFKLDPTGNETVLHSFTGGTDGGYPSCCNLVQDSAGNLYGATYNGGSSNAGVVFEVDPNGNETVLHSFTGVRDGANPGASVVRDAAGNLYGTASGGGDAGIGALFELDPAGHETVLNGFQETGDGSGPEAGVVQDSAGNLYGTATASGAYNSGVVYKIDDTGQETILYQFTGGADGGTPLGDLIQDGDGNLYGTTYTGGSAGKGVVFKLDRRNHHHETVLYSFTGGTDGGYPESGVILDSAGNLFGTTILGGSAGDGVVFKVDRRGNETVLYSFIGGADGANPSAGVIMDSADNLYGTTVGGGGVGRGTVYKLDPTGHETVLHSFGGPDGQYPHGCLLRDSAGNLYGTTGFGGAYLSGEVYKLNSTGNLTVLYSFTDGADGGFPNAGVIMDPAGNLYGTTELGGQFGSCSLGCGVAFELNSNGQETVLHTFSGGTDGSQPVAPMIVDSAGNLFGTTPGGGANFAGVVYKVSPGGDLPAQLQPAPKSFNLSDFGPKRPLPWDVPTIKETGICPPNMPAALARLRACRQQAR